MKFKPNMRGRESAQRRIKSLKLEIARLRKDNAQLQAQLVISKMPAEKLMALIDEARVAVEELKSNADLVDEQVREVLRRIDGPPEWLPSIEHILKRLDSTFTADLDLLRRKYNVCERLLWTNGINPIPHYFKDDARLKRQRQ